MAQEQDMYDDTPDPQDVENSVGVQNQNAVAGAKDWQARSMAVANQGFNQAANGLSSLTGNPNIGDPRVVQARKISLAMKGILTDVNSSAPENEDPMDKNLRVAQEISKRMIDISPQLAMKALQQTQKIQEAKNQQANLTSETNERNVTTAEKQRQATVNKALGTIVFAKQGEADAQGLPTGLVAVDSIDPSDPDYAQKALKIMNDAKQNGDTVIPMSGDKFFNSKDSTAAIRGQYQMAAAEERSRSALAVAQQKVQSGQMTGREYMMTSRIVSAADLGTAALQNIVELPVGSSTGIFGVGAAPGHSLTQSAGDSLRNTLSSQDTQAYNTRIAGLTRNLAMIESAGLMPQGSLTDSMSAVIARQGDTEATVLGKLAEARQIIEKGTQATLNNPRLPPAVRDEMQNTLSSLATAIPFTQHDVTELMRSQAGGKKRTINDVIDARKLREARDNAPESPMGGTYTDQDIAADMANHPGTTKEQVLAAYQRKGLKAAGTP